MGVKIKETLFTRDVFIWILQNQNQSSDIGNHRNLSIKIQSKDTYTGNFVRRRSVGSSRKVRDGEID